MTDSELIEHMHARGWNVGTIDVPMIREACKALAIQPLSKYWKITRIDQDRVRVEAEGMASATVSVMSYEPLEMLLASMAEELLASSQAERPAVKEGD